MEPVKAVVDRSRRFSFLFSPFDIKFYFNNNQYIKVGKGSASIARTFYYMSPKASFDCLGEVGPFCEAADHVHLLIGGEHHNDLVFNASLGEFPAHKALLRQQNIDYFCNVARGPVRLGGNVTLSLGATVRSGVAIGDGAVIGANALVVKDVPSFAIVGGNPGKVLRRRFTDEQIAVLEKLRWWDWELAFLYKHIVDLATKDPLELLTKLPAAEAIPRSRTDQIICFANRNPAGRTKDADWVFVGVEVAGQRRLARELSADFMGYIQQMGAPDDAQLTCLPDLFARCGL